MASPLCLSNLTKYTDTRTDSKVLVLVVLLGVGRKSYKLQMRKPLNITIDEQDDTHNVSSILLLLKGRWNQENSLRKRRWE